MARAKAEPRSEGRVRRNRGATTRRKPNGSNARATMRRAVSHDVADMRAEVDELIASLEERLDRINTLTKRSASNAADGVNELVVNAISGLTSQVADRAKSNANIVTDEVAKFGTKAFQRVVREIDRRPLLTVAIAAGIGFAFAMARRQSEA